MRSRVSIIAVAILAIIGFGSVSSAAQDPATQGTRLWQVFNGSVATSSGDGTIETSVAIDFRQTATNPGGVSLEGFVTVTRWDWLHRTPPIVAQGEVIDFAFDADPNARSAAVTADVMLPNFRAGGSLVRVQVDITFELLSVSTWGQNPHFGGPVKISTAEGGLSGSVTIDGVEVLAPAGSVTTLNMSTLDAWLYVE